MRNKITELEYKMMGKWRDWYGWIDDPSSNCHKIPIREVLTEWEEAKQDLYTLLGNNLILTKEVSFEKSLTEIQNDMYAIYDRCGVHNETRIDRKGWVFMDNYKAWLEKAFPIHHYYYWEEDEVTEQQKEENRINEPIRSGLITLISFHTLSSNIYNGEMFTITLPNGKSYTVRSGCKPMKPLAKFAEAFGIEGFEDFRIYHSQVLNQKVLKGELSLSIHPFDYWTMSDNDCGWDSCMSWSGDGGYRQGTVEMMNSPCVVVAYLNASEPMLIDCNDEWKWSNKKWRSLFIVDKDVILSIKGYPYKNEDLTKATIKWIKELAEQNLGWKYWQEEPDIYRSGAYFTNPNFANENECSFKFSFHSNNMYTDVGCVEHLIYIGNHLYKKTLPDSNRDHTVDTYYYNYSGVSQCICCGTLEPDISSECCLVCSRCENIIRCHECGERVWEGDYYWVGDSRLCEACYDNMTSRCEYCEEDFFSEDVNAVRFLFPLEEDTKEYLDSEHLLTKYEKEVLGYEHALLAYETTMCNHCLRELMRNSVKPGTKLKQFRNEYGTWYYGIYVNEVIDEEVQSYLTSPVYKALQRNETNLEIVKKYFNKYDHMKIYGLQDTNYCVD